MRVFLRKLLSLASFFALGLTLSGAPISCEIVIPNYVSEWQVELQALASSKGMRIAPGVSIADLLSTQVTFDDFENTCMKVLQNSIEEPSQVDGSFTYIDLDSALEFCAVINPWNSLECSGVLGVVASLATEIQSYVHTKDKQRGDLRAACLIASSVAPGRPFNVLRKGSIRKKCLSTCSEELSAPISKIDSSFCSMSSDLCGSIDFTLDSSFGTFNEIEFGIASSISTLISEGALGLKTTYSEGCDFVLNLKSKGIFPTSSSSVSESVLQSEVVSFFDSKLKEVGILPDSDSNDDLLIQDKTLLSVIVTQISDAMKSIFDKYDTVTSILPLKSRIRSRKSKQSVAASSLSMTSSEVSPLSESSVESSLSGFSDSFDSQNHKDESIKLSSVQSDWYTTIFNTIRRGTKEIDETFNTALTIAVSKFDGANVFSSCVSVLRRSRLASDRKVSAACRKIDPFSDLRCQKLNNFELTYLIKLREELESISKRTSIVDLRDLCALSNKMSLKSFIRENDEEIGRKCIKALGNKTFRMKYPMSDKTITKACTISDYIRSSACSDIVISPLAVRIQSVSAISTSLFPRKNDKDRLKMIRRNSLDFPTYGDICNFVYKMGMESVEECSFGLREVLSRYTSVVTLMDIDGACLVAFGKTGIYGPSPVPGIDTGAPLPPSVPGIYPPVSGIYPPVSGIYPHFGPYGVPPPPPPPPGQLGPYMGPSVSTIPWTARAFLPERLVPPGGYIREQYSESRRGLYKTSDGEQVYHDGLRFLINGAWMVKVGDKWYIDSTGSRDLVDIKPDSPKYKHPFVFGDIDESETRGPKILYAEHISADPRSGYCCLVKQNEGNIVKETKF
ncbi:hypothetical protein FG379_003686 [Cryptosporidium bovis]|uniref:uncharacterized protein n=1 Tax=Cryptosporidium bovis TaxID=310047 RepID=UPI00351A3501|nr:hypothetical protein FG379_003686 [Cryptosporidium bovis]